jgi:ZIP family zinc transporter
MPAWLLAGAWGGLAGSALMIGALVGHFMRVPQRVIAAIMPEGLSSAAGMKKAGRGVGYVMGVWAGIAIASAIASVLGYTVFRDVAPTVVAGTMAIAAGAILAMVADTLIPEAVEHAHDYTGLVTVCGFLAAFGLEKLAG